MVIDSSALLAILLRAPEAERLTEAIASDGVRLLGAPTVVETAAVMVARKGPQGEIALDALLQRLGIDVIPMSPEAAAFARSGYVRYGKGVGSPSVLNFGDLSRLRHRESRGRATPLQRGGFLEDRRSSRAVLISKPRRAVGDGEALGRPARFLLAVAERPRLGFTTEPTDGSTYWSVRSVEEEILKNDAGPYPSSAFPLVSGNV